MAQIKLRTGPLPRNFDGSKECWYCGSKKMQPDDRGYVCTKCGATGAKPLPALNTFIGPTVRNKYGQASDIPR